MANRVLRWSQSSQLRQADSHLRAVNQSMEPGGSIALEDVKKFVKPRLAETLRCHPQPGLGMVAMQVRRLFLE